MWVSGMRVEMVSLAGENEAMCGYMVAHERLQMDLRLRVCPCNSGGAAGAGAMAADRRVLAHATLDA